jgi:hypothetical protein
MPGKQQVAVLQLLQNLKDNYPGNNIIEKTCL